MIVFTDVAQWVIAPLFTAGVCAIVILLYRSNKAKETRMEAVEEQVRNVKTSFDNFKYYLVGNPEVARDNGALGDLEGKIDTLIAQTK